MKRIKKILQNIRQRYHIRDYHFTLVFFVLLLSIVGILAVGSAQEDLQNRQIMGVVIGIVVMVILSLIDYEWIFKRAKILYIVNLVLLVSVYIFGVESGGAKRWLNIGFLQFQPSDLTKIITVIFMAWYLSKKQDKIHDRYRLLGAFALLLPSLFLIYKQPNLSNTICIFLLFCVILFLAGLSYRFIGTTLAVIVPLAAILLALAVQPDQPFLQEYQQKRILAWLQPEEYESEEAYQQLNSLMAIGSGKVTGKGYKNEESTSVKNGNFILEPQTDFIFAIIGEEFGFLGCCVVVILILLVVINCILIGLRAKNLGGQILCGGIAALIGIQSFINISVATMLFPNTGISLPFISYGLTSIVCFYSGIGLVLNVGLQSRKHKERRSESDEYRFGST